MRAWTVMGRQSSAFTQLGSSCLPEVLAWVLGKKEDPSQLPRLPQSSLIQGKSLQRAPLFSLFVG